MFRLRLAVVMGSVATAVMLSFAAGAPDSRQGGGQRGGATGRSADRRHADAEESRRARLGLAGEGDDESRHAAAALQPRERSAAQRSADHELHDFELRPGAVLRGGEALRLHLVRDAAQHDVVGRDPPHAGRLSARRRGAVHPHARCLRVQHPEGHRPRRARHHRADRGRRARSAGCGAVLALSAVRPAQCRRRVLQSALVGPQLSPDHQRQHARHRDDRDARGRGDGRGDRGDAWRGRRDPGQQRSLELFGVAAERSALSGRDHQGARRRAEVREVLRECRRAVLERLHRQRRHADGAERPGVRRLDTAWTRWPRTRRQSGRRAGRRPPDRRRADDGDRARWRARIAGSRSLSSQRTSRCPSTDAHCSKPGA